MLELPHVDLTHCNLGVKKKTLLLVAHYTPSRMRSKAQTQVAINVALTLFVVIGIVVVLVVGCKIHVDFEPDMSL